MSLHQASSNVFIADSDPFVLQQSHIDQVINCARSHKLQRARINLHPDDNALVHEMIIALTDKSIVQPHKHPDKCESFHLLRGCLKISFFDDDGSPLSHLDFVLSTSDGNLVYRLNSPLFHSVQSLTPLSLFHETTSGPFVPGQSSVYPIWST